MKTVKSISFVVLLIVSLTSSSFRLMAQYSHNKQAAIFENVDRINGNDLIERLSDKKNNRKNGNLQKAEYIMNRSNLAIINFNGLDYFIKNNRVVGIQGLELSDEALDQITEKLVTLDSVQYNNSERAYNAYAHTNSDIEKITTIDRQFMASLKMLSSTTRDIAALAKAENPSLSVEQNIAKMRLPNVDKTFGNQNTQTLVQLNK